MIRQAVADQTTPEKKTLRARLKDQFRASVDPRFNRWLKRRARVSPPLTLAYRQIFVLPTRFGWLLGLLMSGMLLGSLNFNNNLGLLTTFIVAGVAINSMLIAFHTIRGLEILRSSASPVFAGDDARLKVTVRNSESRDRPGIEFNAAQRWSSLDIKPFETTDADIPIATSKRGYLAPSRIKVQTTHPTGLFKAWSWFWPERGILVWPKPASMSPPLPSSRGEESGRHTRREPEGETFYSLRAWRQGDPLHRIAWKASQRHQTLLAREFRAEESEHLELSLESIAGNDVEQRISILTAWLLQATREGHSWTLRTGGQVLGPDRGESFLHRCLDHLAEL